MNQTGRASSYRFVTTQSDPATQTRVAKALETRLKENEINIASLITGAAEIARQISTTSILVYFLLGMAVLIAIVGGIGLTGTMSMNVLERTREIGVMRSIGAANGAILHVVLSSLASLIPAWNATRLTVRDVLAYE